MRLGIDLRIWTFVAGELPPLYDPRLVTTAFALAFDAKGNMLFAKHVDGKRDLDVPGGHIEDVEETGERESLDAAAIRETHEETGWKVRPVRLLGYDLMYALETKPENYKYPYPTSFQAFFLARLEKFDRTFTANEETTRGEFISAEDARELPWVKNHLGLYELARAHSLTLSLGVPIEDQLGL